MAASTLQKPPPLRGITTNGAKGLIHHQTQNMDQKQTVERDQEIIFANWTDKDFDGMWNKRIYPLKAGRSYYLPFYLAEHFAKHLVDRELNRMADKEFDEEIQRVGNPVGFFDRQKVKEEIQKRIFSDAALRQKLFDQCVQIPDGSTPGLVRAKEVPMREVKLNRDLRNEELREQGITEGVERSKGMMVPDMPEESPETQNEPKSDEKAPESDFEGA